MVQSIRNRRNVHVQRAEEPAPGAQSAARPAAPDRFESIVRWYHTRALDAMDSQAAAALDESDLVTIVQSTLRRIETAPDAPAIRGEHAELARRIVDEMRGLGPLGPLLRDPDVTDIMVNGLGSVYIERGGRLIKVEVRFRDVDHLTHIAQRIAQNAGRRVDELSPMCDARLQDGSRVNIIAPPLAIDGAAISIRRFRQGGFTIAELARGGAMHPGMAAFLEVAAKARLNIVVSGGTGSGKTTLLNALSGHIGYDERIVTLEDAAELNLMQPHVVRLETRPPSSEGVGEIPMRDLLKNALRMRPDRIIVGEVRGAEALDALQAMNTGHPGSMFTIHANNPRDTLARLEYLGDDGVWRNAAVRDTQPGDVGGQPRGAGGAVPRRQSAHHRHHRCGGPRRGYAGLRGHLELRSHRAAVQEQRQSTVLHRSSRGRRLRQPAARELGQTWAVKSSLPRRKPKRAARTRSGRGT